jgi:uncharacterized membrane protein HdeD (DUF308 family)
MINCRHVAFATFGARICAGGCTDKPANWGAGPCKGVGMSQRSAIQASETALVAGGMAFELAKKWWVLLIRGFLLILIGVLTFIAPATFAIFVGAYMLVDGFAMLVSGFGDQPAGQSRWPELIIGILGVIAGFLLLFYPQIGLLTLTYVIAAWALVTGILTIIAAVRLREEITNEWWLIISGVLAILFGGLVFVGGEQGVVAGGWAIATVFGIFAVLVGILSIVLAFRVRDFGTRIGAVT